MIKQDNKVPNAKLTTVWIIWTPPVYWKSVLVSQREYLLRFCHGREEFVEEEELEEEDVETTKACNWLCSVRLTGEDKLPRNSGDRNFTARLFSNKWASCEGSGGGSGISLRETQLESIFFLFPFCFYICTEDAQRLSEHRRCDTRLQSRLKK